MTYEEYHEATLQFLVNIEDLRQKERELYRKTEQERTERMAELKQQYHELIRIHNEIFNQKQRNNKQVFQAERHRLYMEHQMLVLRWKQQNGIVAPFVKRESQDGETGKEVSDGAEQ